MPHAFARESGEKSFTHIAHETPLLGVLLKRFEANICQTLAQNWKINRGIPLGSMGLVAQAKSVLFVSHLGTQKYRKRQKKETDRSKRSALLGFPSSKIALSGETFSASPSSDKFLLQAFKRSGKTNRFHLEVEIGTSENNKVFSFTLLILFQCFENFNAFL
jgi:hypothetical protein